MSVGKTITSTPTSALAAPISAIYTEIAAKFLLENREEAAALPEMLAKRIAKFDPARILMQTPPKGSAE
jgi:hypothetical protein